MSLLDTVLVGGLAPLFGLVGVVLAVDAVREFRETLRVVTGPEEAPRGRGEHATFLDATVASDPDLATVTLGQVHDTFGYWLARSWASGARSNLYTMLGRAVLTVGWGPDDHRDGDDRRRGWAVLPDEVWVRVDGRRERLAFGADAYPLQRLEADGGTVPFLALVGVVALAVVSLFAPVAAALVWVVPLVGVAGLGVVVLVGGGLFVGKLYHDTAVLGRWERVVGLDDPAVPEALRDAGATGDPASTARVDVATATPGDPLRVVGTVELTAEGLRVVDGVVTTRGRWFLAVAATLDAVRTLVWAGLSLAVAALGVVLVAL